VTARTTARAAAGAAALSLPGMVLPPFDPMSGEVDGWGHRWDVRVPAVVERDWPPRLLACRVRSERCPDGRHLFDAIESSATETWDEATQRSSQRFRLVLTCVRCGLVEPIDGVWDSTDSRRTHVDPVPLRSGSLRAQQVSADRGLGHLYDSWLVHDSSGAVVGVIDWARGRRGRAFYTGRLRDWPAGQHIEASTPAGCLRKLARTTVGGAS
jgi:hypothetical protein